MKVASESPECRRPSCRRPSSWRARRALADHQDRRPLASLQWSLVNRYYDPATAQFLSQDPLVAATDSTYGYTYDNPLNSTDPFGLFGLGFTIPKWLPVVGGSNCVAIGDPNCNNSKANRWGTNSEAGVLNGITLGHARQVLGLTGAAGNVDYCSTAFMAGTVAGGAIDAAALGGAAADNAVINEEGSISFGHGARHLVDTALSSSEVESAIEGSIQQSVEGASATGSFWGRVVVGEMQVEYRAYTLADGTINVGTYYVP